MSVQRLAWSGDGFHFTGVDSWGHQGEIDAGQNGDGLKPSDMLPLSLAACTAYDVIAILKKQRQDLQGLSAEIGSTQDDDPPWRFRAIDVRFTVRGNVDPTKARKALALSESKYCSISATLRDTVDLTFSIDVVPL